MWKGWCGVHCSSKMSYVAFLYIYPNWKTRKKNENNEFSSRPREIPNFKLSGSQSNRSGLCAVTTMWSHLIAHITIIDSPNFKLGFLDLKKTKTSVTPTLLIEGVFGVQHDTDICDYIQLCHFLKLLPMSPCQCQVFMSNVFVSMLPLSKPPLKSTCEACTV